jgi:sugar/nucleoside kinase (ribokinase family)
MLGAIQPSLQMRVLDQLENKKSFVLADTIQLWIDQKRAEVLELLKRVGMVCLNDDEATILTGERNLFKAGEWLQKHTAPIVLLKKGEHGSVLFHPEGTFMLPAYPVTRLKDPTGAGDSFAGALIGALAAQNSTAFDALKRAMVYATAVGSLTVEEFSFDRISAPQAGSEILKRVEKLRELTAF